jgi:hypothetical protein
MAMDEMLKMYLDKINQSITELRNDHNIQIENINLKIDEKTADLKKIIEKMQKDYKTVVTKEYCDSNKVKIFENAENEIKKEELSVKKVVLITSCIGSITAILINFGEKVLALIT